MLPVFTQTCTESRPDGSVFRKKAGMPHPSLALRGSAANVSKISIPKKNQKLFLPKSAGIMRRAFATSQNPGSVQRIAHQKNIS